MAPTYQKLEGIFNAVPLTRSLRQEVEGFEPIICLMELIDNAVEATIERQEPTIVITLNLDKRDAAGRPGPAELTIEDNGKGMSLRQLQNYFRVSYTTSRIPPMDRDSNPGVLPLVHLIDRKLNRFGRGSASVVYFGDLVEIESFQAPSNPSEPSKAYMVKCDYGAQLRTNDWRIEMYEKDQEAVDDDLNGWTIIRISHLLPDKEQVLRDVAAWEHLAKRLRQVYHMFIYGFPDSLWNRLPEELTTGARPPRGGLTIELKVVRGQTMQFHSRLSCDRNSDGGESGGGGGADSQLSDLGAVLREWEALVAGNDRLRPCVTCFRYLPPNHPYPPGPGGRPLFGAGTCSPPPGRGRGARGTGARDIDGAVDGGIPPRLPGSAAAGAHAPGGGGGDRTTAGGSGAGSGGGGGGGGVEVIELLDDETDIDMREKDCVCDFVLIWLFFPYQACSRSKPLGENGQELFVFPFWSGKDMIKSKLHGQFPEIYKQAVALARVDQEVQNHAHKLEDPGRLVALLLVSPDALAHQHKSDFEGKGYELFCRAGPSAGASYRPSSESQPRLMTYVWPEDLEGPQQQQQGWAGQGEGDERAGTIGGGRGGRGGRGGGRRKRRNTLAANTPGQSLPLPRLAQSGWYEDLAGGWAAQQLVAAFHDWFLTDQDGCLVGEVHMVDLADIGLRPPYGFSLQDRGMREVASGYSYGDDTSEALLVEEMVLLVDMTKKNRWRAAAEEARGAGAEGGGRGAAAAAGGGAAGGGRGRGGGGGGGGGQQRLAGTARLVEKFMSEGQDAAKQHYALARPWRPRWSPLAELMSESIMVLQPLQYPGGKPIKSRDVRRAEQDALVRKWEGFLPRRLAVEPDEMVGPLRAEYDVNHAFNSITVYLAGNGEAAADGTGGAANSGAAGGRGAGRGRGRGRGAAGRGAGPEAGAPAAGPVSPPPPPPQQQQQQPATITAPGPGAPASALQPPPPAADLFKTQRHYPGYSVVVTLKVQRLRERPVAGPGSAGAGMGGEGDQWEELGSHEASSLTGPVAGSRKYTFTGFGRYARQPGLYRLLFNTQEDPVQLLDPQQRLVVEFRVTNSQPVALDAFFTCAGMASAGRAAAAAVAPALRRPPVVRMGEAMPDVAVVMLGSGGAPVAFPLELRERLQAAWDPATAAAAGSGSGSGSVHPLVVTAEVVNGDPLRLTLRLPRRGALAAGGDGAAPRPVGLWFSPDKTVLHISGLVVKPLELKQTGEHGKANVSNVVVRLRVSLQASAAGPPLTTAGAAGGEGAGGAAASAVAAGAIASAAAARGGGGLDLMLVSGPPARITLEDGNWFNSGNPDRPQDLSKGAELDNALVVRLVDADGNPFYLIPPREQLHMGGGGAGAAGGRAAKPKLELSCAKSDGSRAPPISIRRQAGGGGGAAARAGGARSELVDRIEVEMDSSGNFQTLSGSMIQVTGLPGDTGTLTIAIVRPPGAGAGAGGSGAGGSGVGGRGGSAGGRPNTADQHKAYFRVRKVVLGVEDTDDAPEGGDGPPAAATSAAASASAPAGGRSRSRAAAAIANSFSSPSSPSSRTASASASAPSRYLRDYVLEGTVPCKRPQVSLVDLDKPLEEGEEGGRKTLLQAAFERRLEFSSCHGPREVFLRPSGMLLRGREAVLEAVRQALVSPTVLYEQCFVLAPGQMRLGGVRLSLSDEADDVVDNLFMADVRIFIGSREAFTPGHRLQFTEGRLQLPELHFLPSDFESPQAAGGVAAGAGPGGCSRTVPVHVCDVETRGAGTGGGGRAAAGAAPPFCYGTFYVRQDAYVSDIRLAPINCLLLLNRRVALASAPAVEGVLQLPPATAASAAAPTSGAAAATPPSATVGRARGAAARGAAAVGVLSRSFPGPGAGQLWSGPPQLLLQLVPPGTPGRGAAAAAVDASELVARGFSLTSRCVEVQAGQSLRIPLVAVDALGLPLPPPPALADLLQRYTTAHLEPALDAEAALGAAEAATAAAGGAGAGAAPSGGGTRGGGRRGGGVGLVPCQISDWTWPPGAEATGVETGGGGGGDGDVVRAPQLPAFSFQVRFVHRPGPAALIIAFDPPRDALQAAAAAATATASGGGGGYGAASALSPLAPPPRLQLGLAVQLTHGPLAPAGYRLTVLEPRGVQAQLVSEHPERNRECEAALPAPAACQRVYKLEVTEQSQIRLELRLLDAHDYPVAEDGAFQLLSLRDDPDDQGAGPSPPAPLELHTDEVAVRGGLLSLAAAVGCGARWLSGPRLLLLRPASAKFAHAESLCVYLVVRRGRYPVEPLELVWPQDVHRPPRGTPLRLTLTNDDPPLSQGSPGYDDGDIGAVSSSPSVSAFPRLPAFRVVVHSADGAKLEAEELQPLRLEYVREVNGEKVVDPDQPVTELLPRVGPVEAGGPACAHFYAAPGAVRLPTRAGMRWKLLAVYEDPRIPSLTHRLLPRPVLELELLPAPPFTITLTSESEAGLGPREAWARARVVASAELGQEEVPELAGMLVDRWGNPAPPAPSQIMILSARTRAAGPSHPRHAEPVTLSCCEVDPRDGSFALGPTPLGPAGLSAGDDYELVLQLGRTTNPGGGGEAVVVVSEVEQLVVRTLYVSSIGGSGALRDKKQQLEAEAARRDNQIRAAAAETHVRREQAARAALQYGTLLARLQERGVQLPRAAAVAAAAAAAGMTEGSAEAVAAAAEAAEAEAEYVSLLESIQVTLAQLDGLAARQLGPPLLERGAIVRWQPTHGAAAVAAAPSYCLVPSLTPDPRSGRPSGAAEDKYRRLCDMAAACLGVPGALGPLVMLGAVERRDVAVTLVQLAGGRADRVFTLDFQAVMAVRSRMADRPSGGAQDLRYVHFIDLDHDMSHPQMPLVKQSLRNRFQGVLNFCDAADVAQQPAPQQQQQRQPNKRPAVGAAPGGYHGFIGFAANLVHLPPHLLEVRVPVPANRSGGGGSRQQVVQATLRQSMLSYVFGNAMVFESEAAIDAFRERCEAAGVTLDVPVIAVDGRGGLNLGDRGVVSFGVRSTPPVVFSGLAPGDVTQLAADGVRGGALDCRIRAEQVRLRGVESSRAELVALRPQLEAAHSDFRERQLLAARQAQKAEELRRSVDPELDRLRGEINKCTTELERVAVRERTEAAQQQRQRQQEGGGAGRPGGGGLALGFGRGGPGGTGGARRGGAASGEREREESRSKKPRL